MNAKKEKGPAKSMGNLNKAQKQIDQLKFEVSFEDLWLPDM